MQWIQQRMRGFLVLGIGTALAVGGAVAYATTAEAGPAAPMTCSSSHSPHLHVVDGSSDACRSIVADLVSKRVRV